MRAVQRADRIEARVLDAHKKIANDPSVVTDRERFRNATKMVNELIEVINQAQIPYWRKHTIREKAKDVQKLLDKLDRDAKAAVAEKVFFLDLNLWPFLKIFASSCVGSLPFYPQLGVVFW
ncbi:Alanine--tRNA ligase, cytoplasmic [Toxocara canis]|uniref:Alanine--tRNA ligase, cytoplasmic n=1 Tax=Toxocara canis TaxID=6265 RepID=A0A0B2URN5_TOXCA|nr:Alanine--tRNA ligase, cytoplasmic [Toxocara canis]